MAKRLTVIIPGCNVRAEWWRRCLLSVQAACGENDEIICVDDGSPEKPTFLTKIAELDNRIKVVFRDINGGPSCVRNTGLREATGEYITFVDADDEVMPDVYTRSISELETSGADVAVFGVKTIWTEDFLTKDSIAPAKFYRNLSAADIRFLTDACLYNYVWNKVYRASLLNENRIIFEPPEEEREEFKGAMVFGGEDGVFNLRCVLAGAKWCTLPFVGYKYYRSGESLLSMYKPRNDEGRRYVSSIWREYKDEVPERRAALGWLNEDTEEGLVRLEWDNIWRRGSPIGLGGRWRFLHEHKGFFHGPVLWNFIMQMCYSLVRRHFYIRPIRRWNIRRTNPDAVEWGAGE